MEMLAAPTAPLSDDDYALLADYLDDVGELEIEGLLGLLHAVGVAPSMMPPSTWLPVLLPQGEPVGLTEAETQKFIGLVLRQYNEVLSALARDQRIMPEPDQVEDCVNFAAGFAAGAELDSEWIGDDDRWTFAVPLAYLGGRMDLVPDTRREKLDADPDAKALICRDMAGIVGAANDSFRRARQRALAPTPAQRSARVGRNDPCPCGSGRKFKRCCGAD